jgi:hypothetical protein
MEPLRPERIIVKTRIIVIFVFTAFLARGAMFYCDPAKGSAQGEGSAERPWRTIEEVLKARLIQLGDKQGKPANPTAPVKPGDTVLLRSGWHGVLHIAGGFNDEFITLAAEQGQTPQVGWVEIGEGRKWRVKGLTVSPSLAPAPLGRPPHDLVMLGERGGEDSTDAKVKAADNQPVTEALFRRRLADLSALIDDQFGKLHPVVNRPRLEQPPVRP